MNQPKSQKKKHGNKTRSAHIMPRLVTKTHHLVLMYCTFVCTSKLSSKSYDILGSQVFRRVVHPSSPLYFSQLDIARKITSQGCQPFTGWCNPQKKRSVQRPGACRVSEDRLGHGTRKDQPHVRDHSGGSPFLLFVHCCVEKIPKTRTLLI